VGSRENVFAVEEWKAPMNDFDFETLERSFRSALEVPVEMQQAFTSAMEAWNKQTAAMAASVASWKGNIFDVNAKIDRCVANLTDLLAPLAEEQRVAELSLKLGFVPHAEIMKLLGSAKLPENSEELAHYFWPKLLPQLHLSQADCLCDQKIFSTFSEMIKAHDVQLYQLTTPGAVIVIERAARLTQARCAARAKRPVQSLEAEILELPCTYVRSWRVLAIVVEHVFRQCRSDADADTFKYPNRHAAAHGFGAKASSVVDSLNAVMAAHFVIVAASAVQRHATERSH